MLAAYVSIRQHTSAYVSILQHLIHIYLGQGAGTYGATNSICSRSFSCILGLGILGLVYVWVGGWVGGCEWVGGLVYIYVYIYSLCVYIYTYIYTHTYMRMHIVGLIFYVPGLLYNMYAALQPAAEAALDPHIYIYI